MSPARPDRSSCDTIATDGSSLRHRLDATDRSWPTECFISAAAAAGANNGGSDAVPPPIIDDVMIITFVEASGIDDSRCCSSMFCDI